MSSKVNATDLTYTVYNSSPTNQPQVTTLPYVSGSQSVSSDYSTSEDELVMASIDESVEEAERKIAEINLQMKQLDAKRKTLLCDLMNPDVEVSSIVSELNSISRSKNDLFMQLMNLNFSIEDLNYQKDMYSALQSESQMLQLSSSGVDTGSLTNLANMPTISASASVGEYAAQLGQSFVGVINSDAQGNREFSPGGASQHWCADFATAITKRAWQAKGKTLPSGFGSSAVSGLQSWGQKQGIYLDTASGNAAAKIAQNVKPGDIMIQKRNGASHTGIVTKVYPDGSFDTVEGNSSDAVKKRHYSASSNVLSGFVLMSKIQSPTYI